MINVNVIYYVTKGNHWPLADKLQNDSTIIHILTVKITAKHHETFSDLVVKF